MEAWGCAGWVHTGQERQVPPPQLFEGTGLYTVFCADLVVVVSGTKLAAFSTYNGAKAWNIDVEKK